MNESVVPKSLMSTFFKNLSFPQKNQMSEWIIRQFFADKNRSDIWFNNQIDSNNVLEYISNPRNNFPLTPKEITDFFKSMKSLQNVLNTKKMTEELNLLAKKADEEEEEEEKVVGKHFVGETTLFDIGNELGGITRTAVNKIETIGLEKYMSLYNNRHPGQLDENEVKDIFEKIQEAQKAAAETYVSLMKEATDVKEFCSNLKEKDHIPSRENISDQEQYALMLIFDKDEELIKEMLITDIQDNQDNVFKTFQYFVSYALYKRKKRGRPAKTSE